MWLISAWVIAGLSMLALTFQNRMKELSFALAILMITLADLWAVDFKLNNPSSKSQIDQYLAEDDVSKFLKSDTTLYRIFPVASLFNENRWAAHGIQSIGGYHAAKPRVFQDFMEATQLSQSYAFKYYRVINQAGNKMLQPLQLDQVDNSVRENHQNLVDFLNLKYIISPYPIPEPSLVLRAQPLYSVGSQSANLNIYENTRVLPRAYLVGGYELAASPREGLAYLRSDRFNAREQVLLYSRPNPEPAPDTTAVAEVSHYSLHQIKVHTRSQKPQLLVLSDTYYPPGWHATVDGQPVPILQANHAFRAVSLPAGEHEVVFSYHSRSFTIGLIISVFSLAVIVGALILGIRENRKVSPGDA